MNAVGKQLWDAQTQYEKHFDVRFCRTIDNVSPREFVFMETTLDEQPSKLDLVATGPFPVVVAETHTVTMQRSDNSIETMSCNRVVKTTS